jgi:uncharacterized protein (DUF3820 family)
MTYEEAAAFQVPYGKHKGKALAEVPDYARWVWEQEWFQNGFYKAVEAFLEGYVQPDDEDVPL